MIDLKPHFMQMKELILKADPRFEVEDAEHVTDTTLGIEYHLYDPNLKPGKPYKITKTANNDVLLTGDQLTSAEADILDEIRVHLHLFFTEQAREYLSNLQTQNLLVTPSKINVKQKTKM